MFSIHFNKINKVHDTSTDHFTSLTVGKMLSDIQDGFKPVCVLKGTVHLQFITLLFMKEFRSGIFLVHLHT
jgi:hypothetical protein